MKNKKTIIITAAAIIIIAGGCWIFGGTKAKNKIDFVTEQVQKGNVSNSITATGTIEPVTEVEVGTQVSGIIDKIYIDYNSVVISSRHRLHTTELRLNTNIRKSNTNAMNNSIKNNLSAIQITKSHYTTTNAHAVHTNRARQNWPKQNVIFHMQQSHHRSMVS